VVGISTDPPPRNLAWTKQLDLPFRLLSDTDPSGAVGRQYGAWDDLWNLERRLTFVVDRTRHVRYVELGSLAIDTGRTLEAVSRLARAR
jgi:peroxiredoxin